MSDTAAFEATVTNLFQGLTFNGFLACADKNSTHVPTKVGTSATHQEQVGPMKRHCPLRVDWPKLHIHPETTSRLAPLAKRGDNGVCGKTLPDQGRIAA